MVVDPEEIVAASAAEGIHGGLTERTVYQGVVARSTRYDVGAAAAVQVAVATQPATYYVMTGSAIDPVAASSSGERI
jgi:hypothetical protein